MEKERTLELLRCLASLTCTIKEGVGHAIGQASGNDDIQETLKKAGRKIEHLNRAQFLLSSQVCTSQKLPPSTYLDIIQEADKKDSATDAFGDEEPTAVLLRENAEEIEQLRQEAAQLTQNLLILQEDNDKARDWMAKCKEKSVQLQQANALLKAKHEESESRCEALAEELEREKLEKQLLAEGSRSSARSRRRRQFREHSPSTNDSTSAEEQATMRTNSFLTRLHAKVHAQEGNIGTPSVLVCIGNIPLFGAAVSSFISSMTDNTPLNESFANLCLALNEVQGLQRSVVQYVAAKQGGEAQAQVALSIDYSSSLGNIALDADKVIAAIDPMSLDFGAIVTAAERELLSVLLEAEVSVKRLYDQGKFEEVSDIVKKRLRAHLAVREDVKAFLSVISKMCTAEYFHRNATIEQVLTKDGLKTAWRLFETYSHSTAFSTFTDFMLMSSNELKVFLRSLFKENTTVTEEDKREATNLMLSQITVSRNANTAKRKTALLVWQNAQNFSAKTGTILPSVDLEGLLVRNGALPSDYTKTEEQNRHQRVATRAHGFVIPELSEQIERQFQANNVSLEGLDSFSELTLFSTSYEINQKFGLFETPNFFDPDKDKTPSQVKTMKSSVQNALRRKKSLHDFMQVVNLTGSPEERASKYRAFDNLLN